MTPWEYHPALTRDRLVVVAQLIQKGRNDALDRFDPNIGCTAWTLGCEAFSFQRHQIIEASATLDWLTILDPNMQFLFSIDGVPCRFYRGEPDDPSKRTLKQSYPELAQLHLFDAEEWGKLAEKPLHRLAIETDIDGSLIAVTFVLLNGEVPLFTWQIPLDEPVTTVSPLWVEGSEGVALPAPTVGIAVNKKSGRAS